MRIFDKGIAMRDKKMKFRELAEKRVSRTIKDIRLIGNLSNRNNYDYESDDARKIISALEEEIKLLKYKFKISNKSGGGFKL